MQQRPSQSGGDPRRERLRERLEAIRARSEKSASWNSSSQYLSRLINREGFVPITARLSRADLAFLSGARDEVLAFAELALRLVELHQPQDAGGITSDPDHPIQRCRACMWRWPCPTFRTIDESLGR
ncbi:hypothetical protein [Thermomonospora umbrina]|uniref:Uncharacterized protein n=1 Tax=Thermomonospora umbrina TaxID=111806 RepID=A0A3D9T0Z5_9ACTN|nr:hypothetical protein [Thermomonospora umbrina]REE97491.1 hypothetical protein DFJ69_2964 [Thermomonospora umbrina]